MTTRCIRCGRDIQGVAQYCDQCIAEREAEEAAARQAPAPTEWEASQTPPSTIAPAPSVAATPGFCSSCGNALPTGATFCGNCGTKVSADAGVEYAGFWMRLVALIIDGFILIIPQGAMFLLVDDLVSAYAMSFLISTAYYVGFWVVEGATLGMKAMGCMIRPVEGEEFGIGQVLIRYIVWALSSFILPLVFIVIAFTPEKRGLHDYLAGTVVIKTR